MKPTFFDPDTYCDAIEQMIMADEIEFAIQMLDHPPGYYRDNPTDRMKEIRQSLNKSLYTIFDYAKEKVEIDEVSLRIAFALDQNQPRSEIMIKMVKDLNAKEIVPWITELGSDYGWLEAGLNTCKCLFSYDSIDLNDRKLVSHRTGHKIFVACEVIEHMWRPEDLEHCYRKYHNEADTFILSTPCYTMGSGMENWRTRPLGHIRTYTPLELKRFATKHFPEFNWILYDGPMLVMVGSKS